MIAELASGVQGIWIKPIERPLQILAWLIRGFAAHDAVLVVPPTFGTHAPLIKLFALVWKLSGHTVIGFKDRGKLQPYTRAFEYAFEKRYIDNLRYALTECGILVLKEGLPPMQTFDVPKSSDAGSYIVVHPIAASEKRTLPLARWRSLLEKLSADRTVYVTGAPKDRETLLDLVAGLERTRVFTDSNLREVAGLISGAKLYIGVDTGITHLASVLGGPVLVLGNNSNPTWLPTYNPGSVVLMNTDRCTCTGDKRGDCTEVVDGKTHYRCLIDITDDTVLEAAHKMLS